MDSNNRKALLFAKAAAVIPVVFILLTAIVSNLDLRTVIVLLAGAVYCVFAVKNYLDLRNGMKENNGPLTVTVTVIFALLLLILTAALLISVISGEPIIPGQR